jgi:hypothetical protein
VYSAEGQAQPQPPQLKGSAEVSIQTSSQQESVSGQGWQVGPQALSDWQGTHWSPEGSKPSLQSKAHRPPSQVAVELAG